ncbi:uncharacterized protein LOC106134980 [Amyelois transitella]|uniref:uncharacterized protein LOC106134980 n=1 Tax=Amyelois transitella TaxID=680683 RepID=UPI00298F5284|nr:uncharacterized protein LOC106134980 [Amyelois transitella]
MSSFHERQKNLFNLLKDAEEQHSFSKTNKVTDAPDYGVIDRRTYKRLKHEMKQFRGKESIFKKQDANIRECLRARTVPDHVKNPKKYVYYSLADVTPDQMSDATNTATALALIRQMEEQEAEKSKMDHDDDGDTVFKKPTFRVSSAVKKLSPIQDEKRVFKNNKIIMPEYVVGVSQKKEKKNKAIRSSQEGAETKEKQAELKLNHLYDDDEEET